MCISYACEIYIELATDVYQSKNKILLRSLKDFLTGVPGADCVEEVLTTAFYQLFETDQETCQWLLGHASYLLPEFDLREKAIALGFTQEHSPANNPTSEE